MKKWTLLIIALSSIHAAAATNNFFECSDFGTHSQNAKYFSEYYELKAGGSVQIVSLTNSVLIHFSDGEKSIGLDCKIKSRQEFSKLMEQIDELKTTAGSKAVTEVLLAMTPNGFVLPELPFDIHSKKVLAKDLSGFTSSQQFRTKSLVDLIQQEKHKDYTLALVLAYYGVDRFDDQITEDSK